MAVYQAWCGLVDKHQALIELIATRYGLKAERLRQSSLLTVALHDVGKLTVNFQRMMTAVGEAELRKARLGNYRHEIAGLWVVTRAAEALGATCGHLPGRGRLEALAVAGHHKFLADQYLFDEALFSNQIEWQEGIHSAVAASLELAKAMFQHQGWKLRLYRDEPKGLERMLSNRGNGENAPYAHLLNVKEEARALTENTQGSTTPEFRELFILLKGLLMTADWIASGSQGAVTVLDVERSIVCVDPKQLPEYLQDRHEQRQRQNPELLPYDGFLPFQQECAVANGHVLGVAPTGSGKTEAALAWALRQVELGHARKILFLLPTMVTANSIHDRLTTFFGSHGHKVGLVHSTADLLRDLEQGPESEADRADVRSKLLQDSHFFSPVTVGTIDQLLVPLFHAGRWALKDFAAASSAIILDEIHAYEPHTFGLIVTMIRQLRRMGARFLVMSATMPANLRGVLLEALGASDTEGATVAQIEERTLLDKARNAWSVCETPLSEWLLDDPKSDRPTPSQHFRRLWRERDSEGRPLRILIVANTVRQCQFLARALRKYKPVCYHSKFIFQHRRAKEREINDSLPRLLIATQVVEVSLDIDYDVLLTECAPLDALVQRAGRVNRFRRPQPGRVIVHRHDEESRHVYSQPLGILDRTWALLARNQGLLTERTLTALVDEAYQDFSLNQDRMFLDIQGTIKRHQERLIGILDAPHPREDDAMLQTRIDDYPQLSVIPLGFADRVRNLAPWKRRLYELKMPAWYVHHHREEIDGIPFCKMEYGSTYGGRFLDVPGRPEPGCTVF